MVIQNIQSKMAKINADVEIVLATRHEVLSRFEDLFLGSGFVISDRFLTLSNWPPGGPKMADGFLGILSNFDPSTPSMRKGRNKREKNGGKKGGTGKD